MTEPMTPLRRRMIDDVAIRNMSPLTQGAYVRAVKNFGLFFHLSPDKLTLEGVRTYQLHLVSRRLQCNRSAAETIRQSAPNILTPSVTPAPTGLPASVA